MPRSDAAARREYDRERRARIKADPQKLEHLRKLYREGSRRYRSDPVKLQRHRDAQKNWIENNPDAKVSARLKSLYGITLVEYEEMFAQQNGRCAICSRPERVIDPRTKAPRRLAVDHDHDTGKVRALLCWYCNTGIAKFDEQAELLEEAARYLRCHAGD